LQPETSPPHACCCEEPLTQTAEAALALGATYDPLVLRQLKAYGFAPDAAMARSWYEKAAELGSPAAPRRLEMLTEVMGTR